MRFVVAIASIITAIGFFLYFRPVSVFDLLLFVIIAIYFAFYIALYGAVLWLTIYGIYRIIINLRLPKPGSLGIHDSEVWYLTQEARIHKLVNKKANKKFELRVQAKYAYSLRRKSVIQARKYMEDREVAEELNRIKPILSWEEIVEKYTSAGLSGDELYPAIKDGCDFSWW